MVARRLGTGPSLLVPLILLLLPTAQAGAQGTAINSFDWSGHLPAGATLTIANFDGEIAISPATGDVADVHGQREPGGREDIVFERIGSGSDVTVCAYVRDEGSCSMRGVHSHGDNDRTSASFVVHVPSGVRVRGSTGDGRIDVRGVGADVDASTGDGDVSVTDVHGPVHVSTGDGRVTIQAVEGPANVMTGDGDVEVHLKSVPGGRDMHFSTGNGRVSLYLPATFSGELDATTGDGQIDSDFPLRVTGHLDPNHVRATIGSGDGGLIRVSTGDGDVELRREQGSR